MTNKKEPSNKVDSVVINGNNINVLKTYPNDYFDSIVTDPPYGIKFLGKDWDTHTGEHKTYEECLRVLKPGGHIVAFSAARTYHHLAMALETVGFEIRDQLMWINANGFPKAQDIGKQIKKRAGKDTKESKQWAGWKSSLKPAHEPIVLARKLFKGSCVDNVLKHGTGAMNIDASRIPSESLTYPANGLNRTTYSQSEPNKLEGETVTNTQGRYPSNVIGEIPEKQECFFNPEYNKNYMYCPKVSRKERHIGHNLPPAMFGQNKGMYDDKGQRYAVELDKRDTQSNNHPTVKPVALMSWLVKLITPPSGKVLDPFNGSGSTGMACKELGFDYTGIELDKEYCEISRKRIEAWDKQSNNYKDLFKE